MANRLEKMAATIRHAEEALGRELSAGEMVDLVLDNHDELRSCAEARRVVALATLAGLLGTRKGSTDVG